MLKKLKNIKEQIKQDITCKIRQLEDIKQTMKYLKIFNPSFIIL